MAREFMVQSALKVGVTTKVLDFATVGTADKVKLSNKPSVVIPRFKFAVHEDGRLQNAEKAATGFITRPAAGSDPPTLEADTGDIRQQWFFGHFGAHTFIVVPNNGSKVPSVLTVTMDGEISIEELSEDLTPLNQLWLFKEL
jgi:hypothetical protein